VQRNPLITFEPIGGFGWNLVRRWWHWILFTVSLCRESGCINSSQNFLLHSKIIKQNLTYLTTRSQLDELCSIKWEGELWLINLKGRRRQAVLSQHSPGELERSVRIASLGDWNSKPSKASRQNE
jgi:hypothetical protein